ncbi:MAG: DUF349 domain-containing protein [Bacteroidota bacterium]|nr:DUF349 domain-containing protein [Bacteroidota bacterium]
MSELQNEAFNNQPESNKAENEVKTDALSQSVTNKAIDEIDNSNAEESEDETLVERHNIPLLDYEAMDMEALVGELDRLLQIGNVSSVKEHVEGIKKEFLHKYKDLVEQKSEEFLADNQDADQEFEFHFPLKDKFDALYSKYRHQRDKHYRELEVKLKENLKERLRIIEELKNLINPEANIPDLFRQFNEIRQRWKDAGAIPKDKYNHIWNNYHFHVENFYDYIHLDRELRDAEFRHNLEQKQKVISRAKELLEEPILNKAIRELQLLHKIWKEELGPVSKEYREKIWEEFSDVTKRIHDRRDVYFQNLKEIEQQNFVQKRSIIDLLKQVLEEKLDSHSKCQKLIAKVEQLREEFLKIGKVGIEDREVLWEEFKQVIREFNSKKNTFYKDIKQEYQRNLSQKQELLAKAHELKDSDDFVKTTPIMKQIQEEWKKIGHVQRGISEQIWQEFRQACNHYFDRLHKQNKEEREKEMQVYLNKKEYLDTLRKIELSGDHKQDLDLIKTHIEHWKQLGKVPADKRYIEIKYNKILDGLFNKLSSGKKDAESIRYNNRIADFIESEDTYRINSERSFLIRKIEEIQNDILQLENNLSFITGAKDNNPFVLEVNKSINKQKQELQIWKDKLEHLNAAVREKKNQTEEHTTTEE